MEELEGQKNSRLKQSGSWKITQSLFEVYKGLLLTYIGTEYKLYSITVGTTTTRRSHSKDSRGREAKKRKAFLIQKQYMSIQGTRTGKREKQEYLRTSVQARTLDAIQARQFDKKANPQNSRESSQTSDSEKEQQERLGSKHDATLKRTKKKGYIRRTDEEPVEIPTPLKYLRTIQVRSH